MAERVFQRAVTIAQEHACDRHPDFRACRDRALGERINVIDVEMDCYRSALERFWSVYAVLGHFVDQHDWRIADPDLRMHELAIRPGQANNLDCVERLLVELDRIGSTGANQMRRDRAESFGNCFYFGHHRLLFGLLKSLSLISYDERPGEKSTAVEEISFRAQLDPRSART